MISKLTVHVDNKKKNQEISQKQDTCICETKIGFCDFCNCYRITAKIPELIKKKKKKKSVV